MKQFKCTKCEKMLDATTQHFHPSNLASAIVKNKTTINKCRQCAKDYGINYRQKLKDKGLVRSQRTTIPLARAINKGTIYIIGTNAPYTPYKIGITSGTDVSKRKSAIQTSHWFDIEVVWKSELLDRVDKIERMIHNYFDKKRVRGEWFNITKKDIALIPELINQYKNQV